MTQEHVQKIYGQLGARKKRNPASVSLQTLDLIRYLEPEHAELLEKLSAFVIDDAMLPDTSEVADLYDPLGLTTPWLTELENVGLINRSSEVFYTVQANEAMHLHGGTAIRFVETGGPIHGPLELKVLLLTRPGQELVALRRKAPDEDQVERILRICAMKGHHVEWRAPGSYTWERYTDPCPPERD